MSYQYKTLSFAMPAEENGEFMTCTGCSCTAHLTSACDIDALEEARNEELDALRAQLAAAKDAR